MSSMIPPSVSARGFGSHAMADIDEIKKAAMALVALSIDEECTSVDALNCANAAITLTSVVQMFLALDRDAQEIDAVTGGVRYE